MKRIALALLFLATATACSKAQTPQPTPPAHPVTREQLHELFTVTHSIEGSHKLMRQLVDGIKGSAPPYMPQVFWDEFRTAIDAFDLETAMVPAYQKYFSEDDMKQILVFYNSPAGQRFLDAQPLISVAAGDEVRKAANEIGNQVAQRHAEEIKAAKKKFDDENSARPTLSPKPN